MSGFSTKKVAFGLATMLRYFFRPVVIETLTTSSSNRNHTAVDCGYPAGSIVVITPVMGRSRRARASAENIRRACHVGASTRGPDFIS